jgi:hypothetical protein
MFVKITIADSQVPLGIREISILDASGAKFPSMSIQSSETDPKRVQIVSNIMDSNENSAWIGVTQTSSCISGINGFGCVKPVDAQYFIFDLGKPQAVSKVRVMNYGNSTTRNYTLDTSVDGKSFIRKSSISATDGAPFSDRGFVDLIAL